MVIDLPFIWAGIIAFAVLAYVILDGFDLGVGILFPLFPDKHDRDQMMNSVAPVWDGNETWLVLGGGGLLAVFPLAYATILPALYAPLIAMLIGLIFRASPSNIAGARGAANSSGTSPLPGAPCWLPSRRGSRWVPWCRAFALKTAPMPATGGLADAVFDRDRRCPRHRLFAARRDLAGDEDGGTDCREGAAPRLPRLCRHRRRHGRLQPVDTLPEAALSRTLVQLADGDLQPDRARAGAGLRGAARQGLKEHRDRWPFLAALGLFVLGYAGIGISFYPFIVPPSLTIWQAAAPDESLSFLLVGALVLVPMILGYTVYAYWVFRGKMRADEGYH